ncbi:S8 family peptidase [Bacillus inaquosorum]|uniref:S8 family peptidase n=1 Tax=Bacillus subtilis group TaxID=653685 RepID=UPI0027E43A31|nr:MULTISPECIES: S8 family peptidase [Bacillus subtilis group]MDQ7723547.1 S8 family peptidase [Bacillus halotolerans]MED4645802.1 S8 family peptidase [Bacillus inaquosorum]MED4790653.1 S8 family peptidase [Bacillus inaquosorum]
MSKVFMPCFTVEKKVNYGLDIIGVKKLWEKSVKGKGVNIAIIDTGCDIEHQDLKKNIIGVYNFTSDDNGNPNNVTDYSGHGTHVSGIIGNQNKMNLIGIAPESNLLILKVINKSGTAYTKILIEAIEYALKWRGPDNSKIDIINLSLGTNKDNPKLQQVINYGIKNNVIFVAAAGNGGDGRGDTDEINYPGFYKDVYQIGATDQHNLPASFSNSNKNIDFLAPGKDIISCFPDDQYAVLSGTSMAAPHVSGVIALIKSQYRSQGLEITNTTVLDYLKQKSIFLQNVPVRIQGLGLIQA